MTKQHAHHVVTLIATLTLLFVIAIVAIQEPQFFNPWNSLYPFGGMWKICLVALFSGLICMINAAIGLLGRGTLEKHP